MKSRFPWPSCLWARLWRRSLVRIASSNPVRSMDVCLMWLLCVVRYRSLLQAGRSSNGILQAVVCHWVWSRNLKKEAALAQVGLLRLRERGRERVKNATSYLCRQESFLYFKELYKYGAYHESLSQTVFTVSLSLIIPSCFFLKNFNTRS